MQRNIYKYIKHRVGYEVVDELIREQKRRCYFCLTRLKKIKKNYVLKYKTALESGGKRSNSNICLSCIGCILAERKRQRQYLEEKTIRNLKRCPVGTFRAKDIRRKLREQNFKCFYCKEKLEYKNDKWIFHLEHKTPISRGGSNWEINICVACPKCNMEKGRLCHDEYQNIIRPKPKVILRKSPVDNF